MPAYDSIRFDPPAPVALVSILDPGSGNSVRDVPMLIDSGSDVSVIPRTAVNELGITIDVNEGYELQDFKGQSSRAQAVHLDLVFTRRAFRGKYVIGNSTIGVLGRDILNHLAILLDGPRLGWRDQNPL